jgi:hypothetical protein
MLEYLEEAGFKDIGLAAGLVAGVFLVLGLVALLRCRREDIPAIVRALASWWGRGSGGANG